MTDFLLFTLYAPLASWGDIAVGESRKSWDRPSRSAILGILGAALGIDRMDSTGHHSLDGGYGVAVRLDAVGSSLVDYHTAQTVGATAVKRVRPVTRAELLQAGPRETILSQREYRQNALATVALWARSNARWSLEDLRDALQRPAFVLYAGRKANALGLPVRPEIVTADSLGAAYLAYPPVPQEMLSEFAVLRPRAGWGREVAHDPCEGFAAGLMPHHRAIRRDAMADRNRWQYSERIVEYGLLPSVPATAS